MRDSEIRQELKNILIEEHANDHGTLIVDELCLCERTNRIDIAVVNGYLSGYEIKSEKDTLARLQSQMESYNAVFDFMTAVIHKKHLDKVKEQIPNWWGIIVVNEKSNKRLREVRKPKRNKNIDSHQLSQLLWKDEAKMLLELSGIQKGLSKLLWCESVELLSNTICLEDLQCGVREALKNRTEWRTKKNSIRILTHSSELVI